MDVFTTPPRTADQASPPFHIPRRWTPGELMMNRWFVHRAMPPSPMSIVYFCFDTRLGRPMVVKSLPAAYLPDLAAQKRFWAECEVWMRLGQHPNITRACFVELVNDFPYVFVEWIDGRDAYHAGLDSWIGTPSLTLSRALDIASQVCDGMCHVAAVLAGEQQVFVHRDLKPPNILITGDWVAKITDFGLAKIRFSRWSLSATGTEALQDSASGLSGELTRFLGTPQYMSPEHFDDPQAVDSRSDVYSFGCTLFEMIAGQKVFDADSWPEWQLAHMGRAAPSLTSIRSDVPAHVAEVVAQCLAKKPSDRPENFADLKERLRVPHKRAVAQSATDTFSAWIDKGTSLDSLGKPGEAMSCFDKAELALDRSNEDVATTARAFILASNRAIALEHLRDYTSSLAQWETAAEIGERIPSGYRYVASSGPLSKSAAILGKALTLAVKGDMEQAMTLCHQVLSEEPDNYHAIARMGYLLLRQGRCGEAIPWCRRAADSDQHDMHALANLGAALLGVGEVERARSALERALSLAPTHPPALYSMGTLLLQNGEAEKAAEYLRKAVNLNPEYSEAWNHLGIALLQTQQSGYRECFERALRADPRNQAALGNLVGVIRREDGCDPTNALATALVSTGACQSEQEVAQSFFQSGAFREALTLAEQIVARDKDNETAKLILAGCLHRLGRSDEAVEALQTLERERPEDFGVCHNLGAILAECGRVELAISYYRRAAAVDPSHARTWCGLASLLQAGGQKERQCEALGCVEKATQLEPELAEAHGLRGRILDQLGRNAEALESYERALALAPGMRGEMFGRGVVLLKLARPTEAAGAFEELYHLDPNCTEAVANQVLALAMAGRLDEANFVLRQALEEHPQDPALLMTASQVRAVPLE